jgi:hypothetical protein
MTRPTGVTLEPTVNRKAGRVVGSGVVPVASSDGTAELDYKPSGAAAELGSRGWKVKAAKITLGVRSIAV